MPTPITVLPGLVLDDDLYLAAVAGLATHAPDLTLTRAQFFDPMSWALIPEADGSLSKAELVLLRTRGRTVKLNLWFTGDVRDHGQPLPHSHPWTRFTAHVLLGGYSEDRYTLTAGGVRLERVEHVSPAANLVPRQLWHEVREIHVPGRTLSLMVCDEGIRGDWDYLDLDTGRIVHNTAVIVPGFAEAFAALNPHL